MKRIVVILALLTSFAGAQTNLGPTKHTTIDQIGQASAPANPPAGICRAYYNTVTGQETWINSGGASCGPSGGGGISNSFYQTMYIGSGAPSPTLGGNGSVYVDITNALKYQENYGNWIVWGGFTGKSTHTANYTLLNTDVNNLIIMNGTGLTATLPATLYPPGGNGGPPSAPWVVIVNQSTSSTLTISGNGHTINGTATLTIPASSFYLVSSNAANTNWALSGPITGIIDNN